MAVVSMAVSSLRLVVVDDVPDAAEMLSVLLKTTFGCEVRSYTSGDDCLRTCAEFRPDVVLLDLLMPKMNGFELARQLRRRSDIEPVLIAVSGTNRESDIRECWHAGIARRFLKPVQVEELRVTLEQLVNYDTGN
jgi:CheY-like chemotaxis protein